MSYGVKILDANQYLRVHKMLAHYYGTLEIILMSAHYNKWEDSGQTKYTVTREELQDRSTIPVKDQEAIENKLIELELLIRTSEGLPVRFHYVVDAEKFDSEVQQILSNRR